MTYSGGSVAVANGKAKDVQIPPCRLHPGTSSRCCCTSPASWPTNGYWYGTSAARAATTVWYVEPVVAVQLERPDDLLFYGFIPLVI